MSEPGSHAEDVIAFALKLNSRYVLPFRECLESILSDPSMGRVTCLITDAVLYFTQAVADEFNVRRLVLRTSSVCSFLSFAALPLLRENGYIPIQGGLFSASFPPAS